MNLQINAEIATVVSSIASVAYALIATFSLWLLSRQVRDARRYGAAPALYALLKELEEQMAAVRHLDGKGPEQPEARETILRCLEFFERIEHLRVAGVLPPDVLRSAFGGVLQGYLADPRFAAIVAENPTHYEEVLALAKRIGRR